MELQNQPSAAPTPTPAASPSAPAVSSSERPSLGALSKEQRAVLDFNPFKGAGAASDGGSGAQPQAGEGVGQVQSQTPASAQQPQGQQPPVSQQTDPAMAAIKALLDTSAQPKAPQSPQAQQPQQDDPFRTNIGIPKELTEALFSGEPEMQGQAVNTLATGVANTVLQIMQQRMMEFASQGIPQMIAQALERDRLNARFYAKFPHLDNPALHEATGRVAQTVARYLQSQGKQADPRSDEFMGMVENYLVMNGMAVRPTAAPAASMPPATPAAVHFGSANSGGGMPPPQRDLMKELF